ncbi:MAG TPA: thioredoxin-dependent thiol peroxidase [candidate division Zixibacteria bacterium]|nr:thioredoxin-dependent thiol peroxidase [candidate division Zixibacteria bacterium]
MIDIGKKAPEFCLPDQDNKTVCLKDLSGKWIILYFYPKDLTSGCTKEACEFTDLRQEFKKLDAVILGISPDSSEKHQKFIAKNSLRLTLLSDQTKETLKTYEAWGKKKLYGKEYEGVIRSTFIIDPNMNIAEIWTKVRVKGHAEAVKDRLAQLKSEYR